MQKSALQEFEAKLVLLPTLKIGPEYIRSSNEASAMSACRIHGRQHARRTSRGICKGQFAREVLVLDVDDQQCTFRVLSHKAHCRDSKFNAFSL